MNEETARWLTSAEGRDLLASGFDPSSLRDAAALRAKVSPERAAALMSQIELRGRAVAKFGERAQSMFFTADALEQATRPDVAAWRAQRFVDAKALVVWDLGCGIGADSFAMIEAGLSVKPVELNPVTAVFAQANLGIDVLTADVETIDIPSSDAIFCDPARRNERGRTWNVENVSPSWGFVTGLLDGRTTCLKLGPGVPYSLLPASAQTTWVSQGGDLVEASVWSVGTPGERDALLLPGGFRFVDAGVPEEIAIDVRPGQILYEPDPAIIRSGASDTIANQIGARRISPGIAYLVAGRRDLPSERAGALTGFVIEDVLAYDEKTLRAFVKANNLGTLEIKKRGIDVDPAKLRQRLRPKGSGSATLVLTPTPAGARALVVTRLSNA